MAATLDPITACNVSGSKTEARGYAYFYKAICDGHKANPMWGSSVAEERHWGHVEEMGTGPGRRVMPLEEGGIGLLVTCFE